jgi:hypothetical protein
MYNHIRRRTDIMKRPSDKHKVKTAAKIIAGVVATTAICLNVNGCVYGPPEPRETTGSDTDATTASETTFDPDDNQNADVYGPPEDMEFEPSSNEPATVYGPPSDMADMEETDETEETEETEIEESETSEAEEQG